MSGSVDLARALLNCLDDDALDLLADRLAPRLAERIGGVAGADDGWLDTKRAADYLGISLGALYRRTADHTIPSHQEIAGGKLWFKRSELDSWRHGELQTPLQRVA